MNGALSATGGALTLGGVTGAAGAAISGINTGLGLIKSAFEMGYKRHMRKTVVASELNIDWDKEKDEVRLMIEAFNPDYHMRDHYIREIILRAHGSTESNWKDAYSKIKKDRAEYLMGIAVSNNPPHPYKQTAEQVIEALGVHKIDDGHGNKSFAAGSVKLLEEKLGV